MSHEPPHLVVTNAEGQEQTHSLESGTTWNIGRGGAEHIVLRDESVSRLHAIIQRTEMAEYYLTDAGSRNGTFIRDRRVSTPVVLKHGDEILIGAYRLVFLDPASDAAENPPAAGDEPPKSTDVVFTEHLVTVLVVDILCFTELTQRIGQELLCSFISGWFSDASRIFRAHGSWALKYIGDAVMAVWLHKPGEGQSDQVLSGLTAVAELAEISSGARYCLPVPLSFRAGFNSGVASIGNAGSGDQADFTALGEVVNAAFRIEASTREIGSDLAIGQETVRLLGGASSVDPYLREHSIQLKGYNRPARIWAGSYTNMREFIGSRQR